jgi:hypothetical protein
MHHDRPLALLDHAGQHREGRRQARVAVWEDVDVRAFGPGDGEGGVDGLFDVLAVEVEGGDLGLGEGAAGGGGEGEGEV